MSNLLLVLLGSLFGAALLAVGLVLLFRRGRHRCEGIQEVEEYYELAEAEEPVDAVESAPLEAGDFRLPVNGTTDAPPPMGKD